MVISIVESTADNRVASRVPELARSHPGIRSVELSNTRPGNRLNMGGNPQTLCCDLQSRSSHGWHEEARNHASRQHQTPPVPSGDSIGAVPPRANLLARGSVIPSQRVELTERCGKSHDTFTHFASYAARADCRKERACSCPAMIDTRDATALPRILSLASRWIVHAFVVPCDNRNQVPPLFQCVSNLTVAVKARIADLATQPQVFQECISALPPAFVCVGAAALACSRGAALDSLRKWSHHEKPTNHRTLCHAHISGRMAVLGT
mmetsp:Transcript_39200/g.94223  ORF Transcript_39200/g.94223 Transcript_39200/m.94223 type:complete len:265 (-) Transcript_39200:10-804(-)